MFKIKHLVELAGSSMLVVSGFAAHAADAAAYNKLTVAELIVLAESVAGQPAGGGSDAAMEVLLEKARYLKQQNKMEQAASTWERVLRSNPRQAEALAELARYRASLGHFDLAKEYFAKLKEANPKHPAIRDLEKTLSPVVVRQEPPPSTEAESERLAAQAAAELRNRYLSVLNMGSKAREQKRMQEAQTHFREAMQISPEMPEAPTALADLLLEQGNAAEAEAGYRNVLKTSPGFPGVILGLVRALSEQKKYDDALAILDRHDAKKPGSRFSTQLRSEAYLHKGELAENGGDISAAADYYGKARSLRPENPWITLADARSRRKLGDREAARAEIDHLLANVRTNDANYAAALFYSDEQQWAKSLALLDQIAPGDRAEPVNKLHTRATVHVMAQISGTLNAEGMAQQAVTTLSKAETLAAGEPELVGVVANAWSRMGQHDRTITYLEQNQPLAVDLQLLYAGELLTASQDDKLGQYLQGIESGSVTVNFNQEQKNNLDRIRIAHAMRKADALRGKGQVNEGMEALSPLLARYPQDTGLLLTQGRLQAAAGKLPDALKTVGAVLAKEPGNHEAIRQGATYAIQSNNYPLADGYLAGVGPNDSSRAALLIEAGHAAEAQQNPEKAAAYFKLAMESGAKVMPVIASGEPAQSVSLDTLKHAPTLEGGYAMRYRGSSFEPAYFYEKEYPIAYQMPLKDRQASLIFKAARVELAGGDIGLGDFGAGWWDLFGKSPACIAAVPPCVPPLSYPIRASGTAFSVGYQSIPLSADIGISPEGFQFRRVVGGIRWNTDVKKSNVAVELSRRSVTDSVLAYAGVLDVTGAAWGGVTKTGGQVSIYHPFGGAWAGYASLGLYGYSGSNVANNASNHLNAALIYDAVRTDDREVSVAVRLSNTHFDQNQNKYTWGHGGYYSPQREFGVAVPLHVAGKASNLTYEFNLTASMVNSVEKGTLVFPTDPALQAQAVAGGMAPLFLGVVNSSKGSWKSELTLEYKLSPQFVLGNRFHYEESRQYQQLGNMLYLRYCFDQKDNAGRFPPNPTKPYYVTTQGGAGLN